jgi:small GTP-binding protein
VHFTVCIVGYTNAGKSTLFNTLTAAGTYADDKLFATLDTKTRAWKLERGTDVLLSDTVGFVRDLPHNLVASFKATLEEAVHADLLLHVLDVGHPHAEQQFESVHKVLQEIGAKGKPEVLLLNKVDTEEGEERMPFWRTLHHDAIPISAKTGKGLSALHEAVYQAVRGQQVDVTLETDVEQRQTAVVHRIAHACARARIPGRPRRHPRGSWASRRWRTCRATSRSMCGQWKRRGRTEYGTTVRPHPASHRNLSTVPINSPVPGHRMCNK